MRLAAASWVEGKGGVPHRAGEPCKEISALLVTLCDTMLMAALVSWFVFLFVLFLCSF